MKKLVGSLLLLKSQLKSANKRVKRTQKEDEDEELEDEVEQIEAKIRTLERQIGGGSQNLTLRTAENDGFLQSRLKALVIKQRLLPRLVSRKFEASRLTHGYHKSVLGMSVHIILLYFDLSHKLGNKMYVQVKKSLNNREQGLKTLAQSFNREVENMKQMQTQNGYYKDHAVPRPLDISNLFNMDPSSAVWDSFGLEDDDDDEPPPWQSDDRVRKGIVAKLDLDRCREEEERLWWEISSISRWAIGEAQILADAWTSHGKHLNNNPTTTNNSCYRRK